MTRPHRRRVPSGYLILVADDDPDYLEATRLLLESEGHEVLTAADGNTALRLTLEHEVDLLLLDYFMPGLNGEEVVAQLRQYDRQVQIILQTGFSDDQPPREMLRRLDIQGYYDKGEGPEKLLLWTDAGLKAASALSRLASTADALRQVLELTPHLHRCAPPDLFAEILRGAATLIGTVTAGTRPRSAPPPNMLLAVTEQGQCLRLEAASGDLQSTQPDLKNLDPELRELVSRAALRGELVQGERATSVPLRLGSTPVGALLVVAAPLPLATCNLLHVFVDHAALVIDHARRTHKTE